MHREPLQQLLRAHLPAEGEEAAMHRDLLAFVAGHATCFERSLKIGHITGSAWIVNPDKTRALLVHHAKLNRWLQPGGHADGETDVLGVALREAREETGLTSLCAPSTAIFDVDIHPIPARGDEPEHLHHDVRFLIEADDAETVTVSEESHDVRWFDLDEIEAMAPGASITRMIDKTRRLQNGKLG
jgi:8-oxo-dGTP pyrophosphatase MutT (NUDIX family)